MSRARETALWLFIALMAVTALAVHWIAVRPIAQMADLEMSWIWPVAIAAAFFGVEMLSVNLRRGGQAYGFSMMEIPLVVGLFFVHPMLLAVSRMVGSTLAFGIRRRPVQKIAFNCALFALETGCAVTLWHAVLSGHDRLGPWGWLATGITILVTSVLGSTMVSVAIAIVTGEPPESLSDVVGTGQFGDLANGAFALIVVYVLAWDWQAAWLLTVVAGVRVHAYRAFIGERQRSESLDQVNRFTEIVGREVAYDSVVRTVLTEVREAFGARAVHLRAVHPDGLAQDWHLDGDEPVAEPSALLDALEAVADDSVVLAPRGTKDLGQARILAGAGVRDCMLVPLRSEGTVVGSIAVLDKPGEDTFSRSDLNQVRALANHAAVAIDNAVRAHLITAQAEERERLAMLDVLTGLPNRRMLSLRLGEALADRGAGLLVLNLDRFTEVNETLGHDVGDQLLQLVAARLSEVVAAGATAAHFGGDEFAVLLPGATEVTAGSCVTMIRSVLARPFDLQGVQVTVEPSIGLVLARIGDEPARVLRCADVAMRAAKDRRTGVECYRDELERNGPNRLALLTDLRTAVAAGALDVHYQVKVDLDSGAVVGMEALVRWQHPELGRIGPDEFIPLAEQSSLITPLTMVVLHTALRDLTGWRRTHGEELSVAVNLSPRSLLDPRFVDDVARALAQAGVPARALTLEITETSLMADPERAVEALLRLRDLGVRLSVDDLGTGYSSLAYLQRLPVDELKIDRSFLSSFPDESAQAVVGAIVDLGHRLGHRVVAEGVEDRSSYLLLRELGCDIAQGYWMSRPVPATDLTELLAGWASPVREHLRQVL